MKTQHDDIARAVPEFSGAQVELVQLDRDHPGFNDELYRRRRNQIADLAGRFVTGGPLPSVDYNETEQGIWRTIWEKLDPLHQQRACRRYLEAREQFDFDHRFIESFAQINARLEPMQGFTLAPVAGLVKALTFLQQLGARRFLATQYIRHHSVPLYTPEPDVVHEYVGHVPTLAHPDFAELNHAFGVAALEAKDPARVEALIRVYWYTLEFGVLEEDGEIKVYGAGILSSFGELGGFRDQARFHAFDLEAMAARDYDPTNYQQDLFVAPSFAGMRETLLRWLEV